MRVSSRPATRTNGHSFARRCARPLLPLCGTTTGLEAVARRRRFAGLLAGSECPTTWRSTAKKSRDGIFSRYRTPTAALPARNTSLRIRLRKPDAALSRRWTRAAVEAVLRRFGRSPPYFKRGRICPVAIAALGPSISGQTRTSWPTGGVRDDHAHAQTHLHSYCTYRSAPRIHTQRTSNNKRKNNAISGFKKNICMGRCVCSIAGNRTHGCR